VSLTYVFEDPPDGTTSQTETRLDIAFRSTNGTTALISWGGHIAAEYDWGTGRGATGVSGSPYHTRIISLDGSGGNQDRSLKATAVIIPPPLCAISAAQFACPETPFLEFNSTGSSSGAGITYLWTLTNGSPSAGAKIDPVTGATGATVKVVPVGTAFIAGGTFSLTLKVTKSTGQNTTCSRSPAGTIVKVLVGATATPKTLDLSVSNTSQLNTVLTGSDDTNPANYTYSWAISPAAPGQLDNVALRNPLFTAPGNGTWTFTVTATQTAAPGCADTGIVAVDVTASSPPCKVTGPSPICPSTTNTYKYDPDEDGVANAIPVNFTAQWTLENNTNGASISGSSTGNSVSVVAGAGCGTSYRIKITLTSTSGLITSSCFKDVTVNDTQAPTITSCPADAIVECGQSTDPANTGTATASDNCSASVDYDDETTPGCYTTIKRTWTATDPCGNTATCVQTIIVRDRTAPTIDCSGGGTPTVSDVCSATIDLFSRDDGSTRTWTAVDESGNVATCTQNLPAPPVSKESAPSPSSKELVTASKVVLKDDVAKTNLVEVKDLQVKAYPNPFGSEVNFSFVSPKSGKAVLEIYDLMGRRVGIAFQGNLEANTQRNITYKVPETFSSPIVYKLSVSGLSAHGKLMSSTK
jgi:hypothetical protein